MVYLAEYDLDLAKLLTPGVDLWLNTLLPPLEASGASGMKAALNGEPSLHPGRMVDRRATSRA